MKKRKRENHLWTRLEFTLMIQIVYFLELSGNVNYTKNHVDWISVDIVSECTYLKIK